MYVHVLSLVCTPAFTYACMYTCIYGWMYAWIIACMHVRICDIMSLRRQVGAEVVVQVVFHGPSRANSSSYDVCRMYHIGMRVI